FDLGSSLRQLSGGYQPRQGDFLSEVVELEHFHSPCCLLWHGWNAPVPAPAGPQAPGPGQSHDTRARADAARMATGAHRSHYADSSGSLWATTLMIRQVTLSLESLSRAMSLSITAACWGSLTVQSTLASSSSGTTPVSPSLASRNRSPGRTSRTLNSSGPLRASLLPR